MAGPPTGSKIEWKGGSLDELVSSLQAAALPVRIEVIAPGPAASTAGEVHLLAGGLSDAFTGSLRRDDAVAALQRIEGARYLVESRLPHPDTGSLTDPGPYHGSLKYRPLAALMRYCEDYVLTCKLQVHRGLDRATIEYRRGEIASTTVAGVESDERLPEVMAWADGVYEITLPVLVLPQPSRRREIAETPRPVDLAAKPERKRHSTQPRMPAMPEPAAPVVAAHPAAVTPQPRGDIPNTAPLPGITPVPPGTSGELPLQGDLAAAAARPAQPAPRRPAAPQAVSLFQKTPLDQKAPATTARPSEKRPSGSVQQQPSPQAQAGAPSQRAAAQPLTGTVAQKPAAQPQHGSLPQKPATQPVASALPQRPVVQPEASTVAQKSAPKPLAPSVASSLFQKPLLHPQSSPLAQKTAMARTGRATPIPPPEEEMAPTPPPTVLAPGSSPPVAASAPPAAALLSGPIAPEATTRGTPPSPTLPVAPAPGQAESPQENKTPSTPIRPTSSRAKAPAAVPLAPLPQVQSAHPAQTSPEPVAPSEKGARADSNDLKPKSGTIEARPKHANQLPPQSSPIEVAEDAAPAEPIAVQSVLSGPQATPVGHSGGPLGKSRERPILTYMIVGLAVGMGMVLAYWAYLSLPLGQR